MNVLYYNASIIKIKVKRRYLALYTLVIINFLVQALLINYYI